MTEEYLYVVGHCRNTLAAAHVTNLIRKERRQGFQPWSISSVTVALHSSLPSRTADQEPAATEVLSNVMLHFPIRVAFPYIPGPVKREQSPAFRRACLARHGRRFKSLGRDRRVAGVHFGKRLAGAFLLGHCH